MNVTEQATDLWDSFGTLFYLVDPRKHMYSAIEDVPDHVDRALPLMFVFIVVEGLVNLWVRGRRHNLADSITSIQSGMLMGIASLSSRMAMISTYSWLHDHYRIVDLPWDSLWVWFAAIVSIDCGYYWFHRASHEVGFLWAVHQVHHSSEEFNLSTALRQPIFEGLGWMVHWFYLPCALFIPGPQIIVHAELNFVYQFWIHSDLVGNLGPLEYVLNTASQHRVHHGSNRYCIDKNYGGLMCIWDRLFGTFEAEKENEELVYGLIDQPQFFNVIRHNLFYFKLLHQKAKDTGSLKAWFFGPGWFPNLPRLGDTSSLPEAPKREKHYSSASWSTFLVVILQTLSTVLILDTITSGYSSMGWSTFNGLAFLAFFTAYASGLMLDMEAATVLNVEITRFLFVLGSAAQDLFSCSIKSQVMVGVSAISLLHSFTLNKATL